MTSARTVAVVLALVILLWFAVVTIFIARGLSHPTATSSPYRNVATALRARLRSEGLSYRWVVCVPTQHRYRRHQLSRCNVNFGEPHIVPYCATLLNGRLITDHQNRHLDCGRRVRYDERDKSVNVRS